MRQIKFKGLRTDGKGWVYGLPYSSCYDGEIDQIVEWENHYDVKPETILQFTGLHDKNGVEIYEGDILSCVYWEDENCVVKYEKDNRWTGYWFPKDDKHLIEIIGNTHENK